MSNRNQSGSSNVIDFRSISKKDAKSTKFPVNVANEYRVHIAPEAYNKMKDHASTTDEVELCGVLIGDVCRDDQGFFLQVTAVIEGEGANNYGAQVTFTHDTWSHINEIKDKQYPEQKIVGWYHTHPGFGVFLSSMDSFIQENFFNQPYQIAIVIETKARVEGCFAWEHGTSTPLKRYWVGDEEKTLATGDAEPFTAEPARVNDTRAIQPALIDSTPPPALPNLSSLLIAALLFLCGLMFGGMFKTKEIRDSQAEAWRTEFHSILSFASLNIAASEDFSDLHKRLLEVQKETAATDKTAKKIKDLLALTATLQKEYSERRLTFRKDLARMAETGQHLGELINTLMRQQDVLIREVNDLRIRDTLGRPRPIDPGKMSIGEQQKVRNFLIRLLQVAPASKARIKQDYPGLIEYYYPSPQKKEKDTGENR